MKVRLFIYFLVCSLAFVVGYFCTNKFLLVQWKKNNISNKNDTFNLYNYLQDSNLSDWNIRLSGKLSKISDNYFIISPLNQTSKLNKKSKYDDVMVSYDKNSKLYFNDPVDSNKKTELDFKSLKIGSTLNGIVGISNTNNNWVFMAKYFILTIK